MQFERARICRAKQRHRREDADTIIVRPRATAAWFHAAGMTSDLPLSLREKKGAPTPPVRECAAPGEQLELISPDKFQFATPNWGVRARNPRLSCTDPW